MNTFDEFKNTSAFSLQFKQRKTIYLVVIFALAGGLASLPFISVPLSFQSRGQIASQFPNNALVSSVSAPIIKVYIQENKQVIKGDTLLVLDESKLQEEKQLATLKLIETKKMICDLVLLSNKGNSKKLTSSLYLNIKQEYNQKLKGFKTKLAYLKKELATTTNLYKKGVVSQKEMLDAQLSYSNTQAEISNYKRNKAASWQSELRQFGLDTLALQNQLAQIETNKINFVIIAPISGTIKNYTGIKQGNFIVPNQTLAEITSDGNLLVECLVSPKDIGFVKEEMEVTLQIDAYNYNHWGLAKGKVTEIFTNVSLVNEKPYFRVRCQLLTKEMKLKSGYVGELKKDMTLTGRFKITERTLWQLLYDKVDDWMNPNVISHP